MYKLTYLLTYKVHRNAGTSYVSNYFYYRRIRLERLLYNAERVLSAIAKFLVHPVYYRVPSDAENISVRQFVDLVAL